MRLVGPFCRTVFGFGLSIVLALAPAALTPARAQTSQAAPSDNTTGATAVGNVASVDQNAAQKGLAGKAIDKVKEVAKSAGDILSRVPCRAPKGGAKSLGSLPHVAAKLADGKPVLIIAFGSSSTDRKSVV